ncbi:hypothetical protein LR48_Vigan10g191600 [Vigna angularis]|uniref:Uncharacterized protein n=1 Tax=Phaseolus angularis TaxID=3914 RepID=A0A0L9VMS8_PHAAN|nr:hypothetical protein LR48_Vigan10g191600 [Vigna angularis]
MEKLDEQWNGRDKKALETEEETSHIPKSVSKRRKVCFCATNPRSCKSLNRSKLDHGPTSLALSTLSGGKQAKLQENWRSVPLKGRLSFVRYMKLALNLDWLAL